MMNQQSPYQILGLGMLPLWLCFFVLADASAVPEPVRAALESNCFDCHDDSTAKGKFSLESLPPVFDDAG